MSSESVIELTSSTFDSETAKGLVLVDFWAPWCAPCRMMSPIVDAMNLWAGITDEARACLANGDAKKLASMMDANFDRRASIYQLSEGNLRMVQIARSCGASAKFTGSGGAIIGVYTDEKMFDKLTAELGKVSVRVIKPNIIKTNA